MVVLKNQNRRSGIFYLRPLCGFGFFSKSDFSAIFFSHFRSSTDSFLKFSLLKKKQQGLVIEIALDDCDRNHNAEFSLEDDFPVYWITVQSYYQNIMHEKFCVIDLYTSIHGTFNWTKAANYNKEHISIDKNHSTAAAFADEFMKLKNKKVWNS